MGSGMLLECVYLKLLKGGERFKMNSASKQTRKSPRFSLTIMLSKVHKVRIIFILFYDSLFYFFLLCISSHLLHFL